MKTIKLRDYRPQNAPLWIFLGVIGLLFLVNALAPAQSEEQHASGFIYILTTPAPTRALPTADTSALEREIEALRAKLARLEAERPVSAPEPVYQQMAVEAAPTQPTAGYTAQTDQGPVWVPDDATPVPNDGSYTGPFLAPVVEATPSGPRLCDGFGDWRDYDAMYAASPACHK